MEKFKRHLGTLLHKNALLKQRHPWSFFCELFLAIAATGLLIIPRWLVRAMPMPALLHVSQSQPVKLPNCADYVSQCDVQLDDTQDHSPACVAGVTFGCSAAHVNKRGVRKLAGVWASMGCEGHFHLPGHGAIYCRSGRLGRLRACDKNDKPWMTLDEDECEVVEGDQVERCGSEVPTKNTCEDLHRCCYNDAGPEPKCFRKVQNVSEGSMPMFGMAGGASMVENLLDTGGQDSSMRRLDALFGIAPAVGGGREFRDWLVATGHPWHAHVHLFESADALQAHLSSSDYPERSFETNRSSLLCGAVIFDTAPSSSKVEYTLRFNATLGYDPNLPPVANMVMSTKIKTDSLVGPMHRIQHFDSKGITWYTQSGFLSLQRTVDSFIESLARNRERPGDGAVGTPILSSWFAEDGRPHIVVPFPTPGWEHDVVSDVLPEVLGSMLLCSLAYPVNRMITSIVHEREARLRDGMRMMGMHPAAFYASWILTYMAIYLFMGVGVVSCLTAGNILPNSSPSLLFVWISLFSAASISYALVITAFFDKAKTAATVGSIFYFCSNFLVLLAHPDSSTSFLRFLALLPPVCFDFSIKTVAEADSMGVGVKWANAGLMVSSHRFSLADGCIMLSFDAVFLLLLFLYLDQVVPRETGLQQVWYFPLKPSFWRELLHSPPGVAGEPVGEHPVPVDLEAPGQRAVVETEIGEAAAMMARKGQVILLRSLTKTFSDLQAVKALDLVMYQGEIFAVLGHNGAGKTTTLAMLCGLMPPTSGSCCVFGHSLAREPAQVQKLLGVCPQHDVLWEELTCEEHLILFAGFKGVPRENVEHEVSTTLQRVGLQSAGARPTQAGCLSGGMKRKLSLGIAFLGGSRLVVLDEPTSGLDPYSRRMVWELLRSMKCGRATVLSTHYMDEADILGDRIAILHEGRLRCCGSPQFLKRAYDCGYNVTIVKQNVGCETDAVREAIVNEMPEMASEVATLSDSGNELILQFPFAAARHFPKVLASLEQRMSELNVESYGVSVTTLEEVFLKVASGETVERAASPRADRGEGQEQYIELQDASAAAPTGSWQGREMRPAGADGAAILGHPPHPESKKEKPGYKAAMRGHYRQFSALLQKRCRYGLRDRRSLLCQLFLPSGTLLLCLLIMSTKMFHDMPILPLEVAAYNENCEGTPQNLVDYTHLASVDKTQAEALLQPGRRYWHGELRYFQPAEVDDTALTSEELVTSTLPGLFRGVFNPAMREVIAKRRDLVPTLQKVLAGRQDLGPDGAAPAIQQALDAARAAVVKVAQGEERGPGGSGAINLTTLARIMPGILAGETDLPPPVKDMLDQAKATAANGEGIGAEALNLTALAAALPGALAGQEISKNLPQAVGEVLEGARAAVAQAAADPQSQSCSDNPEYWTDRGRFTCEDYASRGWCTADGAFGQKWLDNWPNFTFDNFASTEGVPANKACCACGGGNVSTSMTTEQAHASTATAESSTAESPRPDAQRRSCTDNPEYWTDRGRFTCEDYASRGWCTADGAYGQKWLDNWPNFTFDKFASTEGVPANKACCACGGGEASKAAPSTFARRLVASAEDIVVARADDNMQIMMKMVEERLWQAGMEVWGSVAQGNHPVDIIEEKLPGFLLKASSSKPLKAAPDAAPRRLQMLPPKPKWARASTVNWANLTPTMPGVNRTPTGWFARSGWFTLECFNASTVEKLMWAAADSDRSGDLTAQEVNAALRRLLPKRFSAKQNAKILEEVDQLVEEGIIMATDLDKDGKISREEFCRVGSTVRQELERIYRLAERFSWQILQSESQCPRYGAYFVLHGPHAPDEAEWATGSDAAIFINTSSMHTAPTFQAALTNARFARLGVGKQVTVKAHPFPQTRDEQRNLEKIAVFLLAVYMTFCLSFIPGGIAHFVVRERTTGARQLQVLSGASHLSYWLSNLAYDLAAYTVPACCIPFALHTFGIRMMLAGDCGLALAAVLAIFGPAVASFSYLVSFLFDDHSKASNTILTFCLVGASVLSTILFVLTIVNYNPMYQYPSACERPTQAFPNGNCAYPNARTAQKILGPLFRLVPTVCVYQAFFSIALIANLHDVLPKGSEAALKAIMGEQAPQISTSVFAYEWAGEPLLYLALEAVIFFATTITIDVVIHSPSIGQTLDAAFWSKRFSDWRTAARASRSRNSDRPNTEALIDGEVGDAVGDESVEAEYERAKIVSPQDIALHVSGLQKTYRRWFSRRTPKRAVRGVTFTSHAGEVFGLLGHNGAGKTSALKVIVGELCSTAGQVHVGGFSLQTETGKARRKIGYCPQNHALLELLTVQDHLELFTALKGLQAEAANQAMRDFYLEKMANRRADVLSGGNKRKLSAALALVGNPVLAVLDEPSCGLDPAARRALWTAVHDAVGKATALPGVGRSAAMASSVLLTTHSMEEAEALSTRLGIMAQGQLLTVGTAQQIKQRHGRSHELCFTLQAQTEDALRNVLPQLGLNNFAQDATIQLATLGQVLDANPLKRRAYLRPRCVVRGQIETTGTVEAGVLAEWWLQQQQGEAIDSFLRGLLGESVELSENFGLYWRFCLPHSGVGLPKLFQQLEERGQELGIAEYTLTQATLEQIFNNIAQEADHEDRA